jgi:hypothetical protein
MLTIMSRLVPFTTNHQNTLNNDAYVNVRFEREVGPRPNKWAHILRLDTLPNFGHD